MDQVPATPIDNTAGATTVTLGGRSCIGIGGVRIDRAVVAQIVEAVSKHAVEVAICAANQSVKADNDIRHAMCRELEEARYEALLAARRYEAVDPTKRLVARELECRWNTALERVAHLEDRIARHDTAATLRPKIDRPALMSLARDLPTAWNSPGTDTRTKQRITHLLIREVVIDLDDLTNEAVLTIYWHGGRHTELPVPRVRCGRNPQDSHPGPAEVIRKLGGQWPDREVVTMNRMRCKPSDGKAWTTVRVRELRERLGIAQFDPEAHRVETVSADQAAARLGICIGSIQKLIRQGVLPATQLMPAAPWQVPVAALESEPVKIGVREIIGRRPQKYKVHQDDKTMRTSGVLTAKVHCVTRLPRRPRNTSRLLVWGLRRSVSCTSNAKPSKQRQAVEALAHVGVAGRQPYLRAARNRDHRRSAFASAAITARTIEASTGPAIRSRAPAANSSSIAPGVVGAPGPGAIVTGANTAAAAAALHSCCRHRNNWLA